METETEDHVILMHVSAADEAYIRQEAGRVYGAKKGSLMKMWHRMIEVYKQHNGEVPVTT